MISIVVTSGASSRSRINIDNHTHTHTHTLTLQNTTGANAQGHARHLRADLLPGTRARARWPGPNGDAEPRGRVGEEQPGTVFDIR
jgi:hypothetical protein